MSDSKEVKNKNINIQIIEPSENDNNPNLSTPQLSSLQKTNKSVSENNVTKVFLENVKNEEKRKPRPRPLLLSVQNLSSTPETRLPAPPSSPLLS